MLLDDDEAAVVAEDAAAAAAAAAAAVFLLDLVDIFVVKEVAVRWPLSFSLFRGVSGYASRFKTQKQDAFETPRARKKREGTPDAYVLANRCRKR